MSKSKLVSLEAIGNIVDNANSLLSRPIPQYAKSTICSMVEQLLFKVDCYDGFGYNYWRHKGITLWEDAGEPEAEKLNFIIGPNGAKATNCESDFTSDIEGEYSRVYFTGKLRRMANS